MTLGVSKLPQPLGDKVHLQRISYAPNPLSQDSYTSGQSQTSILKHSNCQSLAVVDISRATSLPGSLHPETLEFQGSEKEIHQPRSCSSYTLVNPKELPMNSQ